MSFLYVEDVLSVVQAENIAPYSSTEYAYIGSIEYEIISGSTIENCVQVVKLSSNVTQTPYTINKWTGEVVDLVALFVSAGLGTVGIITTFVGNLLVGLGIKVVGSMVTIPFMVTVSSQRTRYTWKLFDRSMMNISYVIGDKYYINEDDHHIGEIYYEGITPKDWGTNSMAMVFYPETYSARSWNVVGWNLYSGNGYI